MALVKSGTFGSSPSAYYEIHADLLGGSANTRQVKVHLALKVNGSTSSSNYGYPLNWLPKIHTSNGGWQHVKGSERWNATEGLRWYSWTATVDVGTTASTSVSVGFDLKRSDGGSSSWNTSQSGSFNVGSTNVPPVISGTVSTSPSGTIAENTSTIKITSPEAKDGNNNLSGYRAQVSINDGGYTEIYRGASREYNHNVSGYGQGTTFKYRFDAYDASGAYSVDWVYSGTVTKNTFTGDTLTSSSSIKYTDNNSSISFTYSGAKNTNGNTTFTRKLTCDGITVYGTLTASPATVTVYRSGATPSGAYVRFDDIKNKFKSANYVGTLTFTLTTTNAYGTVRTSTKAISVDLRTAPNPATQQVISTNPSESTMYKKIAFANNYYFLPDGNLVARIKWTSGSGKLGEAISYEIYVAYGGGGWQKIADINGSGVYYNHVISKQSISQQFKYLIRTKNVYGYYSDAVTSSENLHYYNQPSITVGQINRTETTAEIPVTIKTLSSIPNISTVGTWSGQGSGTLNASQTEQKINIKDLTGDQTYTITVVYNDNTGFSGNQSRAIAVGANLPIMFLNKYGLGVGGSKADGSSALKVNGNITSTGSIQITKTNMSNKNLNDLKTAGFYYGYTGMTNAPVQSIATMEVLVYSPDWIVQRFTVVNESGIKYERHLYNGNTWSSWRTIYDSKNKPSAGDVGALSVNGGTIGGTISRTGTSQSWLNGAKGDGCLLNMTSQSGYSPIIRQKTSSGAWTWGAYTNDTYHLTYMTDNNINAGNNSPTTQYNFPTNGGGTVYTTGNKPGWDGIKGHQIIRNSSMYYQEISIDSSLFKNGVIVELFGRNKQQYSLVNVEINGSHVDDWTLGASCYFRVEVVKGSTSLIVIDQIINTYRAGSGSNRVDGTSTYVDGTSLTKIAFRCQGGSSHAVADAVIKVQYY